MASMKSLETCICFGWNCFSTFWNVPFLIWKCICFRKMSFPVRRCSPCVFRTRRGSVRFGSVRFRVRFRPVPELKGSLRLGSACSVRLLIHSYISNRPLFITIHIYTIYCTLQCVLLVYMNIYIYIIYIYIYIYIYANSNVNSIRTNDLSLRTDRSGPGARRSSVSSTN